MITKRIPWVAYIVVQEFARAKLVFPDANEWRMKRIKLKCFGKTIQCLRYKRKMCPMGFHPKAESTEPFEGECFPCRKSKTWDNAVMEFASWWDYQTDAAAALAEIERVKGVVA